MLEKIITDKNIDIRLDADLKTPDGKIANGSYSNGVITINPNSTRTGEFIAVHELTHAIGTDSMRNIMETYIKSNPEFNTAVEKLLQNYNSTEITDEALSDVSAQLFGNQEFINNVAQTNPNIFQKIYSEIKYLWHQFRGYKNQDQFVEDLYYKWTQAYNSNNKLNNTTNYYIETVADFNEMEYNNSKEIKLPKQEYAILSGIVNSDSNIKPGRNYVETTNATYEVYFKETGEFKVVGKIVDGGYYDTITNENIQGTGNTRDAESGMQVYSPTVQQSRTGTRNDEISDVNKRRTRISDTSIKNGSSNSNNVKYSIQESENNSIKINDKGEAKYVNENQKENNIYFRFDNEGEFKGEEHKSGVSMWEENIDDLISDNYESDYDENDNYIEKNKLLEKYGTTQEEYDNLSHEEQLKIKRKIGLDEGLITDGASVLDLSHSGIEWFRDYEPTHHEMDYPEVNFFTGKVNGEGVDGENVVIPDKILLTTSSKDIENIYDDMIDYKNELEDTDLSKYEVNKKINEEFTKRLVDLINEKTNKESENNSDIKNSNKSSFNLQENKQKQLEIIQKNNKMQDDYHTGIRTVEDIKTLEETLKDSDWSGYDEFNPDYTRDMTNEALKTGRITVYSSYPIKQGTFVSPSKMEEESYSGNGKVYSKEININDVAWIDPTQGQYVNTNQKYSLQSKSWQQYLNNNFKATWTRTNLQDIKNIASIAKGVKNNAPIKKSNI